MRMNPLRIMPLAAVGTVAAAAELPEMTVMAERRNPDDQRTLAEWTREDLSEDVPRTLDELLAREPSFSLFRRQTALFGNPTSAGVSLRNTGASAASRTLVLLDGIPQNDPFGGWVYWARYDPAALESVRIVPSAQAAVWGNQSPAGVVQLAGRDAFGEEHVLRLGAGDPGGYAASTYHQFVNPEETVAFSFAAFGRHSDGFHGVSSGQRGGIDRRLDLDLGGTDLKLAWKAAPGTTVESAFSLYTEERGNGTPLARNSTEALDFSLRVTSAEDALTWQALAYYQRRNFESMFSSVNSDRSGETPSLDQFDVPGEGTGGAFTLRWEPAEQWSVTTGMDFRHLTGETHEDATYLAGRFTRRREAGGGQTFAGVFATAGYAMNPETRIDGSIRGDAWWLADGRRIENSLIGAGNLRSDKQPDRDGVEPSFALALTRKLGAVEFFTSAGSSFRLPTLNELHRPFRVRNDIVEANPELEPERFFSVEGGADWQANDSLRLRASMFHHWIRDAIANVPVTDPAAISEIFGTIPPGGSGSQRQNVDQARVLGAQGSIEWRAIDAVTLSLDGIWTRTEFSESREQPLLEGKPFSQAPDLRLIAGMEWRATDELTFSSGYEYGASQFDDALAERRIPDYTSLRAGLAWRPTGSSTYYLQIENLLDEEIYTGVSTDGIRSVASPRSLWLGAEWRF